MGVVTGVMKLVVIGSTSSISELLEWVYIAEVVCSNIEKVAVKLMGNIGNTVVSMGRTEELIGIIVSVGMVEDTFVEMVEETLVGVIGEPFVGKLEGTGVRKIVELLV